MSVPQVVARFYEDIWEKGDLEAASRLVSEDFAFRGSLGVEVRGRDRFLEYVRAVRAAVGDYRCEILACVAEGNHAFAKVRFSGIHAGVLRGYPPTGKHIAWIGAALFRFDGYVIAELWVLGDLAGLDTVLAANSAAP